MKPLGSSAMAVYEVIERHFSLCGQSPSIPQIMAEMGFKTRGSVAYQLDRLEQAEWITREPHQLHAIIPVKYPRVHYRRADAAPGWVYAAPDYTDHCPDCDRSANAHRNPDTHAQPNPNRHK